MPEFSVIQTRSKLPSALIATAVLLVIVIAIYFYGRNRNPQLAITHVQTYVARSELKAIKPKSKYIGSLSTIDTDLYVLVNVKLTDNTSHPLFIKDETGVLTAPDHSILESSAILTADLPQVFNAFPDLQKLADKPLLRDTEVSPGQTVEGTVLLHYPSATEANWNSRESATVTLDFFHNDPITLNIPQ
jgi:hypothetical protein